MQYIQNVKSGRCVTINKDENFSPLSATKCNCNPLQLWKNQDGEVTYLSLTKWLDDEFLIRCIACDQRISYAWIHGRTLGQTW